MDEANTHTYTRTHISIEIGFECRTMFYTCTIRIERKKKSTTAEKHGTKESNAFKVAPCQRERIMVNRSCLATIIAFSNMEIIVAVCLFIYFRRYWQNLGQTHIETIFMSEY